MKFAIISDTHFGDPTCALVTKNKQGIVKGPKYPQFKQVAGQDNDYLVMAGDVFDFSITSYENAYEIGRAFFTFIRQDNIAKEIIYIPGNHDADLWHIIQHQKSVINRMNRGDLPEKFDHSVAGILDDRQTSQTKGFWLNKVKPRNVEGEPKYGNMFLDFITGADDPLVFNIAYPNLYVATDRETVLVTHGQYLEPYWSLLGEFAVKIAHDDLKVGEVDVEEMVEMNFPLNQFACTGLGQAGVLTNVVRQVQRDVKDNDLKRVGVYANRLEKVIDEMTKLNWVKEFLMDLIVKKAKEKVLEEIGKIEQTRYCEEFVFKKDVRDRFHNFFKASLLEIGAINDDSRTIQSDGFNMPAPTRIIFGHTHQPIAWNEKNPPKLDSTVSSGSLSRLTLHNTGGWLLNKGSFCGAEVFVYQTGSGFSSRRIV